MKNNQYEGDPLNDEQFERYLALLKSMYERMRKENSWPWSSEKPVDDKE